MPSFVITTTTVAAGIRADMASDAGAFTYIAEGVTAGSTTGSFAISGSGNKQTVTVAGHAWSQFGNAISLSGPSPVVTIQSTGSVTTSAGGNAAAVSVGGSGLVILNDGEISGGSGIYAFGSVSRILNNGTVSATGLGDALFPTAAILLDGGPGSSSRIVNTGVLVGGSNAPADGGAHLAEPLAITEFSLADSILVTIDNSGTIVGSVQLGNGTARIINTGEILGLVALGDGSDLYEGWGAGLVSDIVLGEGGDDTLNGGDLADRFDGGTGNDRLRGNAGDDTLLGGGGLDTLIGGAGDDLLDGGIAVDLLFGGTGADTLQGGGADDRLLGGSGDDLLDGGTGNDTLSGEGGADILLGGSGVDRLTGGADADVFLFAAVTDSPLVGAPDRIVDFTPGEDRIDLSALGANLTFLGTGALAAGTEGVRFSVNALGHAVVLVDNNADGTADLRILLLNTATLAGGDFIL